MVTKGSVRCEIWDHLEKNNIADFPRPVHHRIPNFKGSTEAAQKLSFQDFFKSARVVKVNPDKAQEWVRFLTLEAKKQLLVPTPRLRNGLFNRILPPSQTKDVLKTCSTKKGIHLYSKPVGLDARFSVDLIVIGSVAVSKEGFRIGKGEGYADMEYGMMKSVGAITDKTLVVTTVHDCQIRNIPEELIGNHDVMIDVIVTPTQVIQCSSCRPKPSGIYWSILDPKRLEDIPVLKLLREKERKKGQDVTLKT